MLSLVGLGIAYDPTLEGLKEAKAADELYLESYTMPMEEKEIAELEKAIGKRMIRLAREKVEGSFLIQKAKEKSVCLLVVGDPLSATTHISLLMDAKKAGIPARIVHNSSILSAAPSHSFPGSVPPGRPQGSTSSASSSARIRPRSTPLSSSYRRSRSIRTRSSSIRFISLKMYGFPASRSRRSSTISSQEPS